MLAENAEKRWRRNTEYETFKFELMTVDDSGAKTPVLTFTRNSHDKDDGPAINGDIPCPACGAPSCPYTKTTRKRSVSRCCKPVEGEGGG